MKKYDNEIMPTLHLLGEKARVFWVYEKGDIVGELTVFFIDDIPDTVCGYTFNGKPLEQSFSEQRIEHLKNLIRKHWPIVGDPNT